ncbi:hypothetical protein AKJ40_01985 [candidate division MSBL1 archaeon SCGC-AAA259M10]|uniref:2Fe-2S ferredoxin-type domain-containing protein n=1 Tax=candidate division MSBL1 archaeon SCGC-AAA259M10 TaxID=1698270 RepID=A0A133V0S1_9EURY|nr:hypothetical protein AKJ40_01985 [candidate division MSBL1 archaeon SCGC-AAA259M10]
MARKIRMTVNGEKRQLEVEDNELLAEVLRDNLGLTGVKMGCESGNCGVCTIVMEGEAVLSCSILAPQADGSEIITVEGLSKMHEGEGLHPIQEAFIDNHGVQCGYCTPGFLMSTYALLKENSNPSEDEIRKAVAGNLCRCTGYDKIIKSIKSASEMMDG